MVIFVRVIGSELNILLTGGDVEMWLVVKPKLVQTYLFVPRFVADLLLISAGIGSSFVLLSCSLAMHAMLP
jgi:hypothetical protein